MSILQSYEDAVGLVAGHCGGQDKFAHTYVGLAIWLGASLALRRPRGAMLPLLVVIAVELANECTDRVAYHSWRWADTLGDMAATWFWPVVLTLVDRRWPALRAGRPREVAHVSPAGADEADRAG